MNDFTRHYGEFDGPKADDAPEVAAEKAVENEIFGNGDVHGLGVSQRDLAPEADEAGEEEYGHRDRDLNAAVHTDQRTMMAANAGSTGRGSPGSSLDDKRDKEAQSRQNRIITLAAATGLSMTAAQALAFNDFVNRAGQMQDLQEENEALLRERDRGVQAVVTATTVEAALAAGEQLEAANAGLADNAQAMGVVQTQFMSSLEGLAEEFATPEITQEQIVTTVTQFMESETADPSMLADMPEGVQQAALAARYPSLAQALDSGQPIADIIASGDLGEASAAFSHTPHNDITLASLAADQRAADVTNLSRFNDLVDSYDDGMIIDSIQAMMGSEMHPDQMREIGMAFLQDEQPDIESIKDLPPEIQELLIEDRFPELAAQARAEGRELTDLTAEDFEGVAPTSVNIAAYEEGNSVCAPSVLEQASMERDGLGGAAFEALMSPDRAAVAPASPAPVASGSAAFMSPLEGPRDHASVSGFMDVPNSYGAGRQTTVYANGTLADGAFQDARAGFVMPAGDPGLTPDQTLAANNANTPRRDDMDFTMRDPTFMGALAG